MQEFLIKNGFHKTIESGIVFFIRSFNHVKIYVSESKYIYLVQSNNEISIGDFSEEKIINFIKILD